MRAPCIPALIVLSLAAPLALVPSASYADEVCPELCVGLPPQSLVASSDASDECERISRENNYPCHSPRAQRESGAFYFDRPRRPSELRHRTERQVPDSSAYGLY